MIRARDRTVEAILDQQIEIFGPGSVSLHCLWRAAGCPEGRGPQEWSELASPLIAGLFRYLQAIPSHLRGAPAGPLLRTWDGDDAEPWRVGDLVTHEVLARLYAAYLEPNT